MVLLAGMLLLSTVLWFSLRHILFESLESELKQLCRGAVTVVQDEGQEGAPLEAFQKEMVTFAESAGRGKAIEVRNSSGALIFSSSSHPFDGRSHTFTLPAKFGTQEFQVTAVGSLHEVHKLLERFRGMLLWAMPAVLLLASFGGYWISRRALRPVDDMTAAAHSIGIRNLSLRLATPNTGDELQRLSETWNEMLERLEAAVRRLTQFTADASHELRTPVALIRTTAELALRRERTAQEYRDALQQIMAESERTSELVADLLTLARADAGPGTVPLEPLDLTALIEDVCARGRVLAGSKSIQLISSVPETPVMADGNVPALSRLLLILLDNAVKFTPEGGSIRVSLAAGSPVTLTVQDTGVGIPENALPHIFERFYRADPARNRDSGGTGLGLSIAIWIAEIHNAELSAESVEGQGTTFRLRIQKAAM